MTDVKHYRQESNARVVGEAWSNTLNAAALATSVFACYSELSTRCHCKTRAPETIRSENHSPHSSSDPGGYTYTWLLQTTGTGGKPSPAATAATPRHPLRFCRERTWGSCISDGLNDMLHGCSQEGPFSLYRKPEAHSIVRTRNIPLLLSPRRGARI